jgi:hypothetical protein
MRHPRLMITGMWAASVLLALTLAMPALVLAAPPPNDDPPGIAIASLPFTFSTDTTEAQIHALEPSSTCALGAGNSVWFSFAPGADIVLVADTIGSDYDTLIDVFQGSIVAGPDPFTELTLIACNDNNGSSPQSRIAYAAEAGQNYVIRVSNPLGSVGGALTFNASVGTVPDPPTVPEAPPNDDPPGITIESLPFTFSTNTILAQIHAMEPNSTCVLLGGNSVWFNFSPTVDIDVVADTLGSDYDTVIDVFEGSLVEGPDPFTELSAIACNDNTGSSLQSRIAFTAQGGATYLIRISIPLEGVAGELTFNLRAAALPDAAMPRPSHLVDVGFMLVVAALLVAAAIRARSGPAPE